MEYVKVFVQAVLFVDEQGKMKPLSIIYNGRELCIDRITRVCTAPPEHVGGLITRKYECIILGRERSVFVDADGRWFVEARRQ